MSAVHLHHVDGRHGPGLPHVDPALAVDLTPADHRLLHLILDDLGVSWPEPGDSLLLHRARRHAVTFGWAADHGRELAFTGPAVRAEHALWLGVVAALEGGDR